MRWRFWRPRGFRVDDRVRHEVYGVGTITVIGSRYTGIGPVVAVAWDVPPVPPTYEPVCIAESELTRIEPERTRRDYGRGLPPEGPTNYIVTTPNVLPFRDKPGRTRLPPPGPSNIIVRTPNPLRAPTDVRKQ